MSRVYWDTNLFIYLFEDLGSLGQRVAEIKSRMAARGDQLLTSALSLGEVLVKPLEMGQNELSDRYLTALTREATIVPFDVEAATHYATIRQDRTIRPADAIQLACAAKAGVDLFITNDDRLSTRMVEGIQFIVPLDRAFI